MPSVKAMDLFDAFAQDKLPKDNAYIVSSFVNAATGYIIYEIISYSAVKAIYPEGSGITFQSSGKKLHILVEPASYPSKGIEPYLRQQTESIPLRFSELDVITTRNQIKIYMAREPNDSLSSFTVAKPSGYNVSFLFYFQEDIYDNITKFFEQSLNMDAHVPQAEAKKIAKQIGVTMKNTMAFRAAFK